ncbi:hypothetical protein [Catenuloplanes atrovinosus]|uniref:Uncharacterized protein n=1 Tax=Catenuloplanes atrovinosus TaxID=137266 RepID=A0AAE4CDX3_9ACTN|nr:hypothetical protein [Catenuloplanes atrovinosus]MDR7277980.1 hypothetical protein [Catenuloplanes atrovinosus]
MSVDSGRRVRRRRRWFAGAGGGTAAAVLAVVGLFALGSPSTPSGTPTETPTPAMNVAAPSDPVPSVAPSYRCVPPSASPATSDDGGEPSESRPATAAECPGLLDDLDLSVPPVSPSQADLAPATAGAVLQLLTELVPEGRTGGWAYQPILDAEDGGAYVQLYLDRGLGFGMLRLYVGATEPVTDGFDEKICQDAMSCAYLTGTGLLVVEDSADDCTRRQVVSLYRADGVQVRLQLADCLMFNGREHPPGEVALSLQEAVTVVVNPVWSTRVPLEVVKTGDRTFEKLTPIVGG